MPNLAEKEKMETFLAGVQAHVATNHNRAFLAAALGLTLFGAASLAVDSGWPRRELLGSDSPPD